jgi:hypothetical protein
MQDDNKGGMPLSFVVPTEFVDLPSEGKFYPEDHPLHGKDSIELKQMTAREEDILTSQTLLKKGVALDRVIESVIVDKRIDANTLLIGDRNAIIIAIRSTGYGSDYSTSVTCPSCGETNRYEFDLKEANIYRGEDAHQLDLVDHEDGTFTTTLPRTSLDIRFRLLVGHDEKRLLTSVERARKRKGDEHSVTAQLANLLVAVNEDDSAEARNYVINNLPSMDSRHLRMAYKLAAPNIDLKQYFECPECEHSQDMEVPLGAEFFWPDR